MAFTPKQMAALVGFLGLASFICGLYAEIKKPPAGTPLEGKGVVICQYPFDPTPILGYLSAVFLFLTTAAAYFSLFYPYKGKAIPREAAFRSGYFTAYFYVALGTTAFAATLLLWPTVTEHLHLLRNVHFDLDTQCPTAKTGLLGGGAYASLDACLFWLVCLMLATNAREDFFEEEEKGAVTKTIAID